MSRHSKWAQIKHQKSAADVKRGKLFTVLSKRISIAARSGGDPEMNPALKDAILRAKTANMPQDTISRAVKRGTGELPGQGPIEEVIYEAYGPLGVQLIIITSTDNRNRATSNIRRIMSDFGGSISGSGSVLWNFERTGTLFTPKTTQAVDEETKERVQKLINALDQDDNVEEVFTNLNT